MIVCGFVQHTIKLYIEKVHQKTKEKNLFTDHNLVFQTCLTFLFGKGKYMSFLIKTRHGKLLPAI